MGGDENRVRAHAERDLQEIPRVQAKDRSAVGMQVTDGLKPAGEGFRLIEAGKKDQVMDLPYSPVLFIDGADFAANNEPGLKIGSGNLILPAVFIFQRIKPFLRRNEFFLKFPAPGRMGEISRPDEVQSFPARPKFQNLGHAVFACRSGVLGMNMKIGNEHLYHTIIFINLGLLYHILVKLICWRKFKPPGDGDSHC
ncbi:MAG TPA: hypothetical protein VN370_08565 [Desulfitobacteriaceae bacterium]|nr:hypothetical protein [Desulfitobacteriaceae bacterium]